MPIDIHVPIMGRQKKNGCKNCPVEKIVLATAILNLVKVVIELIDRLSK